MTAVPDWPSVVASAATRRALRPRADLDEPGWRFWELRSLNMHRVVGLMHEYRHFADAHDFQSSLRGAVSRNFKCSWWRGMGFGVVAEVTVNALGADDLKRLVDGRENPKGTLQWVVLVANDTHSALSVHTWMEAYLSPVYRDILQALSTAGYKVASARKEKDGLMKFLAGVADWETALANFGARRQLFPEFRDDPGRRG